MDRLFIEFDIQHTAYLITRILYVLHPILHGRPRKSWSECVKVDCDVCNLDSIDPQNREAWRSGCEKDKPTAAYPRNWKTICSLNIKPGLTIIAYK